MWRTRYAMDALKTKRSAQDFGFCHRTTRFEAQISAPAVPRKALAPSIVKITAVSWSWWLIQICAGENPRSESVIFTVPGEKFGQSHGDRRRRLETQVALTRLDIGIGRRHVARLHWLEVHFGLSPQ